VEEYERLLLKKTSFAKADEVCYSKRSLVVPRTNIENLNDDQKCWATKEILGIMREGSKVVFQPQYAQCFTATTLQQTYEYNFQSQNISTVSNIPKNKTVNSPNVSDALSNHSSRFLDSGWTEL